MNDRAIDFAKAYRLSRLGMFLLAAGLILVCAVDLPGLVLRLLGRPLQFQFWSWMRESGMATLVGTAAPWTTLTGSALLWAAWEAPAWRRRAGLLMTMCLVDVGCWFLDLGDPNFRGPHAFFRMQLGAALGWPQFALLAGLSGEILAHLGVDSAEESARSTRSLAASGAVVWLLLFFETTNLQAGWPLQRNPWMTLNAQLLWLASDVIHAICLVQATALVVAAFRSLNDEILRGDADGGDPSDPNDFPPDRDPFEGLDPGRGGFTAG